MLFVMLQHETSLDLLSRNIYARTDRTKLMENRMVDGRSTVQCSTHHCLLLIISIKILVLYIILRVVSTNDYSTRSTNNPSL